MQKKVGNALYVFDTTPFTITKDTDAEVIYVQQEYLKGYLELNTELESKIKTFNQWLLCVNAPWADGGTPEPEVGYHLLTVSSTDNLYVEGYDSETLPGDYSNDWFGTINENQRNDGMIDGDVYDKIYCNAGAKAFLMNDPNEIETVTGLSLIQTDSFGERYGFIMGDSDMTVDYSYTLKPTYSIRINVDSDAGNDLMISPNPNFAGNTSVIRFDHGQSSSTITVTSDDVELQYDEPNDEYYFTMPDHDVYINAIYVKTEPNYHLLTVSSTDNLYVLGYDTEQLPGFEENNIFDNINRDQRDNGMIESDATNKIYLNAGAKILLDIDPNEIETVTGLSLIQSDDFPERYGFVMGDSDMTVDYSYTLKPKYNVNFSEDSNAQGQLDISQGQQYAGGTVRIELNSDYSSVITVTSEDVELTRDDSDNEYAYTFTMPAHDVTIKAVYNQPSYNVGFSNDTDAAANDLRILPDPMDPIDPIFAGFTVSLIFKNYQSPSTITVTSEDVELTYNDEQNAYTFTMPANDVTIKAVYQPIEVSIDLGDTDLTYDPNSAYDPSATYYPHAQFIVNCGDGKTINDYTYTRSQSGISVSRKRPDNNGWTVKFNVGGSLTFANA